MLACVFLGGCHDCAESAGEEEESIPPLCRPATILVDAGIEDAAAPPDADPPKGGEAGGVASGE
jgi:hypothetical protein